MILATLTGTFRTRYRTVTSETYPKLPYVASVIAELDISLSIDLFESFIDQPPYIDARTGPNISLIGLSREFSYQFKGIDAVVTSPGSAGGAGVPVAGAALRPLRHYPLVDRKILLPDNCGVMV
jgi:hypothetical protein